MAPLPPAPKKMGSFAVRAISAMVLGAIMILGIAMGHLYFCLLLIMFSFKCYFEIINIKRRQEKEDKNAFAPFLEVIMPLGFFFYLMPKTFVRRILLENGTGMADFKQEHSLLYGIFFVHHGLCCGVLLLFVLVLFTLSLKRGQYKYQFQRMAWLILSAICPIYAALFLSYYVYKGFFWLLIANGSVMINDLFAYFVGKSIGRTPLIKISPNKTWEGFIGGGIFT